MDSRTADQLLRRKIYEKLDVPNHRSKRAWSAKALHSDYGCFTCVLAAARPGAGGGSGIRNLAIQSDDKIVIASVSFTNFEDFGIARYNPDGTLDDGFGSGGATITDFAQQLDDPFEIAIQSDGKIIVAGSADTGVNQTFALARYNGNGGGFDICLQDEASRKGIVMTGRGSVRIRFCKTEFNANQPDHSITALANTCTKAGSASVKLLPSGGIFTISDRDMSNNTCTCR
jgi:uncharacterized delta-60 repeat protein